MTAPAFYDRAECRGVDTHHFYPLSPSSRPSPLAVMACSRCGVREECLSFSLAPFQQGVWGGMTEAERLAERKARYQRVQTERRRREAAERRVPEREREEQAA